MSNFQSMVGVGLITALLGGCSWLTGDDGYFRDTSDDYRKASITESVQVPEDLDGSALQEIYVIPEIAEDVRVSGQFEVPRPAPLVSGASEQLVRIQKLGREQWILVSLTPGQLWPQVRGFLGAIGAPVARVEARAGLIETSWLEGDDSVRSERYRFRLEQGVQRNTAELHVLQMFRVADDTTWPEISSDPVREDEMLNSIAQFIANNAESAPVSMMAQQSLSDGGKVTLQEDRDGTPYIQLQLPYHRAWASLERSLVQSSFRVRDKDRSTGTLFVRYVEEDEDDDGGWFGWLFSDDEEEVATDVLTQQDFVVSILQEAAERMRITLVREDGEVLEPSQAQAILARIKGNIN